MPEKPLILFIPRWYPDKNDPLHGIFMQRHAKAASKYANIVVLYATSDETLNNKPYYHEENDNSLKEIIYYYRKRITGLSSIDRILKIILYFYCMYIGFYKIQKQYGKPELCHVSVMLRTGIFAYWLKIIKKIKFVYTEHWGGYHPYDGNYTGFRKLLYPYFISKAEWILPVTANLINVMQSHGIKGKYKQIGNVVDTDLFTIHEKYSNSSIIAIHISNFDNHSKNITGLIEALDIVSRHRSDFKLHIVGNGSSIDSLKEYAAKFKLLNKFVFFLGSRFEKDLINEIAQSDFLVMFSNYENQPCVISEAMACGKPVLATTVGGIPEMVNNKTGVLTAPGDINQMATSFMYMLDHYKSYNSIFIRSVAKSKYSFNKIGKQFFDVYREVINN